MHLPAISFYILAPIPILYFFTVCSARDVHNYWFRIGAFGAENVKGKSYWLDWLYRAQRDTPSLRQT